MNGSSTKKSQALIARLQSSLGASRSWRRQIQRERALIRRIELAEKLGRSSLHYEIGKWIEG